MAKKIKNIDNDVTTITLKRIDRKAWHAYGVLCQMKGTDRTKEMRNLLEKAIKSYAKDNQAFSDFLKTL